MLRSSRKNSERSKGDPSPVGVGMQGCKKVRTRPELMMIGGSSSVDSAVNILAHAGFYKRDTGERKDEHDGDTFRLL